MEKFLEFLGIAAVCVFIFLFVSSTKADATEKLELYVDNDVGGILVMTLEKCTIESAVKQEFERRAYSTDSTGGSIEACWTIPDISKAPSIEGMVAVPSVNFWYEGNIFVVRADLFKPLKEKKFVPEL